ncbi:MAG: hypothetical protein ABFQ62_01130 [Patescibacteria group bacterium]
MTEKKSSKQKWSILEFYEESWDLLWKHKKLWILGLAANLYLAGGGRINLPNFSEMGDSNKEAVQEKQFTPEDSSVLGSSYEETEELGRLGIEDIFAEDASVDQESPDKFKAFFSNFENIKNIFASVPTQIYVLLGLEFLAFMVFSVILGLAASAWAEAALMKGISQAYESNEVNLTKASQFAVTKIKSLLWVKYIPMIRFIILTALAAIGIMIVTPLLLKQVAAAVSMSLVIVALVGTVAFFYLFIRLQIRVLYAKWHCVIDNLSGSDSFKKGIATTQGNMRKTLLLGFLNILLYFISALFFIIPFVIFAVLLGLIVFLSGIITSFSFAKLFSIIPFVIVIVALMIIVYSLISALIQVFMHSVWYLAFKAIGKK